MSLRDVARPKEAVVTAAASTPAADLATTMRDHSVGCVVITEGDRPVGVVTDRDIAIRVVGEGRGPRTCTAAECMTSDPVTVDVDDGVADVCRTMREHGVRRVPVTDGGALAGIVTMDDVLVLLDREMDDLTSVVEAESPPYTAA